MERPVGVPAREGGVVDPVSPADAVVVAAELAVGVAVSRRGDHRVIHRRVENTLGALVGGRDVHASELFLPRLAGLFGHPVEIPAGNFAADVLQRVVRAYGRNGDLQGERFELVRETDDALHTLALQFAAPGGRIVAEDEQFGDGAIALHCKIDAPFGGPSLHDAAADERVFVDQTDRRGCRRKSVALAQIDEQPGRFAGREAIAVACHAARGGQFGRNAVVELQRITIGRYLFVFVTIVGRTAVRDVLLFAAARAHLAREGHDLDVAQIGAARTAEVGVREPDQYVVGVVVARAPVPALEDVLRADLHRAERHACADEDVAVAARSDVGIDIAEVIFVCGRDSGEHGDDRECENESFHAVIGWIWNDSVRVPPPEATAALRCGAR